MLGKDGYITHLNGLLFGQDRIKPIAAPPGNLEMGKALNFEEPWKEFFLHLHNSLPIVTCDTLDWRDVKAILHDESTRQTVENDRIQAAAITAPLVATVPFMVQLQHE